jgi:hypothetical protein
VKEKEIKQDGPETIRTAPTLPRTFEGRERLDPGIWGREIPEKKKETPLLRKRAIEESRPAPKKQSVRERIEPLERDRETGSGTKSPREDSFRGKERSKENGRGTKEH